MTHSDLDPSSESVELPEPTAAPLVLALGISLAAAGVATSYAFAVVGALVFVVGLGLWISHLLPGKGHIHEPLVDPSLRPRPITVSRGGVQRLQVGMPGYRLRLPVSVHPISSGIKGGLIGGLVMPIPALAYGFFSGHGIWLPINLLAGMVMPGVGDMTTEELGQFSSLLLIVAILIHFTVSLLLGLIYGVLMPTLPSLRKPLAWGSLLMPLLWTAASFIALGFVNPSVRERVEWPWFIFSQFIFGVVAAAVFLQFENRGRFVAGLLGGMAGGLLMPIPAVLWSILANHGIWYPVNLLSAMAMRNADALTLAELQRFHAEWLLPAIVLHAVLSISFGLAFAVVLPKVPSIPSPFAWGGMVMPILWTGLSYGLMGIVNPVLQQKVDWPWFVASQFVFGVAAAIVIERSQQIHIPPAGRGPEKTADFLHG